MGEDKKDNAISKEILDKVQKEIDTVVSLYPHSLEVARGQKGGYGWTYKLRFPPETPVDIMVSAVKKVDDLLRTAFGSGDA